MWEQEEQAAASLAEAVLLGEENDVRVEPITVRARAIGQAILEQAGEGASPIYRARLVAALAPAIHQFFSPTVDYVLRSAPCEVLVVPFPRVSSRTISEQVKLVVIGCGRVGASVARDLARGRLGRDRGGREGGGACAPRLPLVRRLRRRARDGCRDPAEGRSAGCGRGCRRDVGRQHESRHRPGRGEALRRPLRRRPRARPRTGGFLRRPWHAHGLPDADRDLGARRRRPQGDAAVLEQS